MLWVINKVTALHLNDFVSEHLTEQFIMNQLNYKYNCYFFSLTPTRFTKSIFIDIVIVLSDIS